MSTLGLQPRLTRKRELSLLLTWMLGIGLVISKLGQWPSFILNQKLALLLDVDLGHWTCHCQAGLVQKLLSLDAVKCDMYFWN